MCGVNFNTLLDITYNVYDCNSKLRTQQQFKFEMSEWICTWGRQEWRQNIKKKPNKQTKTKTKTFLSVYFVLQRVERGNIYLFRTSYKKQWFLCRSTQHTIKQYYNKDIVWESSTISNHVVAASIKRAMIFFRIWGRGHEKTRGSYRMFVWKKGYLLHYSRRGSYVVAIF